MSRQGVWGCSEEISGEIGGIAVLDGKNILKKPLYIFFNFKFFITCMEKLILDATLVNEVSQVSGDI